MLDFHARCLFFPGSTWTSSPKLVPTPLILFGSSPPCTRTVLAVWPMKPGGSAPARFEMDLRDCSCHLSTSTQEAQGFQCVVSGHYLVVYSAHCAVWNLYSRSARRVYSFCESRTVSQEMALKRPINSNNFAANNQRYCMFGRNRITFLRYHYQILD